MQAPHEARGNGNASALRGAGPSHFPNQSPSSVVTDGRSGQLAQVLGPLELS